MDRICEHCEHYTDATPWKGEPVGACDAMVPVWLLNALEELLPNETIGAVPPWDGRYCNCWKESADGD